MAPEVQTLANFLTDAESIVVLTGAGVSTPSGIPDYRDRNGDCGTPNQDKVAVIHGGSRQSTGTQDALQKTREHS